MGDRERIETMVLRQQAVEAGAQYLTVTHYLRTERSLADCFWIATTGTDSFPEAAALLRRIDAVVGEAR